MAHIRERITPTLNAHTFEIEIFVCIDVRYECFFESLINVKGKYRNINNYITRLFKL